MAGLPFFKFFWQSQKGCVVIGLCVPLAKPKEVRGNWSVRSRFAKKECAVKHRISLRL